MFGALEGANLYGPRIHQLFQPQLSFCISFSLSFCPKRAFALLLVDFFPFAKLLRSSDLFLALCIFCFAALLFLDASLLRRDPPLLLL